MNSALTRRIDGLDDKQAIYVAQKLAQAIFQRVSPPSAAEMIAEVERVSRYAGVELHLGDHPEWNKLQLRDARGGELARTVLHGLAADEGLAPAVERALELFHTDKQDFGVISVGLAIGLTYALIAMDVELDLGFVKIRKAGLKAEQQADVVVRTAGVITKAIGADVRPPLPPIDA